MTRRRSSPDVIRRARVRPKPRSRTPTWKRVVTIGALIGALWGGWEFDRRVSRPFQDTFEDTSGGYDWYAYRGPHQDELSKEERLAISYHFDEWDRRHGDLCRNTGWKNVRTHNDRIHVAANCRDVGEVQGSEPEAPVVSDAAYTKIDYSQAKVQEGLQAGKFDRAFLSDLEAMCGELDMHCMGLLSVMDFETSGTFDPAIKNPKGSATGLIQFTAPTARGLGTSTDALAQMTQREQLYWVQEYFERQRTSRTDYNDPKDIALTIFYPKAVGRGDGYVIAKKGSMAYKQNRGLDRNPKDKKITAKEYVYPALNRGYDLLVPATTAPLVVASLDSNLLDAA